MTPEDKRNIIRGLVREGSRWVSLDKKMQVQAQRRKMIEQGLVFFQGEWVPIEQKLSQVLPPKPAPQSPSQVNVTHNVYNDNRSFHQENVHEHRHVHVDPQTFLQSQGDGSQQVLGRKDAGKMIQADETGKLPPPKPDRRRLPPPDAKA